MIDWGSTPVGSIASIYLPGTGADAVISMASRMYVRHGLSRVDDHTVTCRASGVTYVPIPRGTGSNYTGLLSIVTPPTMRRGTTHNVVVRQLTNAKGYAPTGKDNGNAGSQRGGGALAQAAAAAQTVAEVRWRKVIGAFQLTFPVRTKASLLPRERVGLSVLRWIREAIPHHNRWYPVFHRYLGVISGRVAAFGGEPGKIAPSPTGGGHSAPGGGVSGSGSRGGSGNPGDLRAHEREAFTGKIAGIAYDGFGDFEAFVIETKEGERHRFESNEGRVLALVQRAWTKRILITVMARRDDLDRPLEIILLGAPPHEE
jgi:hypothetical protein